MSLEPPPPAFESKIPEPPADAEGGPVGTVPRTEKEQPPPEATEEGSEKLQEEYAAKLEAEKVEKARRIQADIDAVKTWKKKNAMELQNMEPDEKADYEEFTTYQIPMLEKRKGNKTFLNNLLGKYKKLQKKFKDAGKKTYKEDYNIAYINMLLNK